MPARKVLQENKDLPAHKASKAQKVTRVTPARPEPKDPKGKLDNYYLSPNGDGLNETLELEAAADYPNNSIQIYNRYGQLVFQQDHYTGGFDGKANVDLVVSQESGLEDGIYFYIITFHDLRERHQGYFYLNR